MKTLDSLIFLSISLWNRCEAQITLFDLVQPNQNTRAFDTLSAAVSGEYDARPMQFDWSNMIAFGAKPISIPTVNQRYRSVLYDGDMVLSEEQLAKIVNYSTNGHRSKREAFFDEFYPATIWENGLPYELHGSLSMKARLSVMHAIRFWAANTCVKFRPRTFEKFFLQFVGYEEGCWSTVGRDDTVPMQIVSIGHGCEHFGVTSHELAHALGVFHEQSRYDRDSHVALNNEAVEKSMLYNFAKIGPSQLTTYDLPYDVGSVMHYAPTEFAKSKNAPALNAIDPLLQQSMGSMDKPSFLDVLAINLHYKCTDVCSRKLNCQHGGYTDPTSCDVCKCPDGYGGKLCDHVATSFSPHCGGTIEVTENVRKFEISIVQTSTVHKDKMCVYHLKAPPGKRILINLLRLSGKCIEGCYVDGIETKLKNDKRPVGYRFCCAESQLRRLVSESNEIPLMVYSRQGKVQATFEYTYIDNRITHDASSPLTADDLTRLEKTNYVHLQEQSSPRLGLHATVSEPAVLNN